MTYKVLAQKYRPDSFDDVVGQEAVTRTIKNSIVRSRVANAYIFCGPRGVGKTTVARLIAKMLNCERPAKDGPCNKCAACAETARGSSMDVLEIDGASNRGIDEIRTLRENVKFLPTRGKFKVYIIDEVHMLTTEAFNALLKTLEEPPPHVKFIFATTEAHKVLPTIMSRCQRFDFRKIQPALIFERLKDISKKEKIDIDEKAALLIARSADGSLRDALVVLDQMVSFSEKKISVPDVVDLLGMIHNDRIFGLADALIRGDIKHIAGTLDELISGGKDPVFIANSLISHFRDLMILKTAGAPTMDMALSEDEAAELNKEKEKLSLEEILYILQNLSNALVLMKGTMFTRAPLEIALVRLAKRGEILSLADIMARLEEKSIPHSFQAETVIPQSGRDIAPKKDTRTPGGPAGHVSENVNVAGLSGVHDADGSGNTVRWGSVMNYIKNKKMSVYTSLSEGKLVDLGPSAVVIGFGQDKAFHRDILDAENSRKIIQEALSGILGISPKLEFKVLEFLGGPGKDKGADPEKKSKTREAMKPVIDKAMDIFGGEVVRDISEEAR